MERILSESAVLERESQVDARIAKLRQELDALEVEKAKIQGAKELFGLFGIASAGVPETNESQPVQSDSESEKVIRPEGIPSTREMILWIVREANRKGSGPTQLEIFEGIRRKWWPDAPQNRIRPMIWSLWKKKEILTRRKDRYFAVKMDEAPAA